MQYTDHFHSGLGEIFLAADETGLTGLWFDGQKYFAQFSNPEHDKRDLPVFEEAKRWLMLYFTGKEPDFSVPLHLTGTDFQRAVWDTVGKIPYGHTLSYRDIAEQLTDGRGVSGLSARAVGNVLSRNPILIFVPCHRVIRKDGDTGGYAAGREKKRALLALEKKGA